MSSARGRLFSLGLNELTLSCFFLHSLFLYVLQQLCFTWVQLGYLIGLVAVIHSIGGPAAYRFFNTFYPDAAVLGIAALDGVISYAYLAIPVMSSTYVYFGMF